MAIKCKCGNIYNENFKFCPECAEPNPSFNSSSSAPVTPTKPEIIRNDPKEHYYEDDEPDIEDEDNEEDPYANEQYYEDEIDDTEEEIEEEPANDSLNPGSIDNTPHNYEYDPNHDGYYDDRLPLLANEIVKTSYKEAVIKGLIAFVGLIAVILYCIYFVKV